MELFLGQFELLPYNFAPSGWATCEGQLLSLSQNTALFSLLGTYFAGDVQTNFALPDLRDKEPTPNTHYCIALRGIYPPRS
jgi:microcystin-dependent protein